MWKTIVRRPPGPDDGLPHELHPVLRRVLAARGICSPADLDLSLQRLLGYDCLSGITGGVDLLVCALKAQQRIVIVADFDADGATACAVAVRGLRLLGASKLDYIVPDRFRHGYGLSPEIVDAAKAREPDLLITVDNGISSLEGVERAKRYGMRVLITDHHLPGAQLPLADAIVNPNLSGDGFPSKHLAGVGVMFYLLAALRARLRESGAFQGMQEPNLAGLLDLVAVGTVSDVVPLDKNNRVLVAQGLSRIRAGRCCAGIKAICRVAGTDPGRLTAQDLAYVLGPRLNAAGRLTDMSLGIECLLTDDDEIASALAARLQGLNDERREIETRMHAQATESLRRLLLSPSAPLPYGLCLYDPDWHQGVVGILASRIKDRLHRPVIAFAPDGENGLKGSGRSVAQVHIRDVLARMDTRDKGLIKRFGGHAMAAGLSLAREHFERFCAAFDESVKEHLEPADLQGVIESDGELSEAEFSLALAEALRSAAPWGQGFPAPLFDGQFELLQRRVVGQKHLKMTLRVGTQGRVVDAIAFHTLDEGWPGDVRTVELGYQLDVNEYTGERRLQLLVEQVRPLS
ncbi:MAG: single-stranded-DNA-specific exonuclease RecJ [Gammaproteobacteria bacterium]